MRCMLLLMAIVFSLGLSLILSLIFHSFIFFAFLPLLFIPFGFRRRVF